MKDPNAKRPGYKKTEVGWIPREWIIAPLGSVALIQTGVAKGKDGIKDPIKLPYLRVANVQDGRVDLSEVKCIAVASSDVKRYSLQSNDVLFTEGGDFDKLGRGCVWDGQIQPCLHQNHVFAVRCDSSKLLPAVLALIASSPYGRRYFTLSSKQSTNLASINSTQLKAFPIPVPPLPEQRKISSILSTCDDAIERTRELIAAKREQKKGLMQLLLTGKRRLRGFSTKWSSRRLDDLCDRVLDSADNPSRYPVLSITAGTGFVSQEEKFSRIIAGRHVENYVLLRRGQFSYNKGNSYRYPQGCVYQLKEYDEGLVPDVFYSFQIRPDLANDGFIQQHFLAGLHNEQLSKWVNTGVRNNGLLNLNASDFFNLRIPLPELNEQRAIAEVLTAADAEIAALERKLTALREQKRGLMQKLLTGAIRVEVGR